MNDRPETTLFMLASLDGKISTGDIDSLDVDVDFPRIKGVREGLQQYYDLEKLTDRVSLNSGKVQAKVGVNGRAWDAAPGDVDFVIIDNLPHLDRRGTEYFAKRSKHFYLITTNMQHPAFRLTDQFKSIRILYYEGRLDFSDAFNKLKVEYGVTRMTIQTGGTLNAEFLRLGLIDHVSLVIAPCLIGGISTQSLISGQSLHTPQDLLKVKALTLTRSESLNDSYLHLTYDVLNETVVIEN